MLTMLSVKEILMMNAELRLPSEMPRSEKQAIVNSVIQVLGLHGTKLPDKKNQKTKNSK